MHLLELTYQDIAYQSRKLSERNNNPRMRIGKSTLGNIISGSIRQPSGAKLDSLRSILHLSRADVEAALGRQSQDPVAEQLEMGSARTYQLSDEVTRHRVIRVPIARNEADLNNSQFLDGLVHEWASMEVEYLSAFYPPHLIYVVVGDEDNYASPVAPPGTRLLVNTFLTKVEPAQNLSYHQRPLFFVLTPHGFTCSYLESAAGKIVLLPHPMSGHVREEFMANELKVIGQVVGLLFPGEK